MFDKTKEYKEMQQMIRDLKDAFHKKGIPYQIIALTSDDGKKTTWESDGITPGQLDLQVSDDRIKKAIRIMAGIDDIPRITAAEIGMEFDNMLSGVEVTPEYEYDEEAAAIIEKEGKVGSDY